MTLRRKSLVVVAAALVVANAVALAMTFAMPTPPPSMMFWAGHSDAAEMFAIAPLPPDGRPRAPVRELRANGAYVDGRPAPIGALVSNMGRARFLQARTYCGGDHSCEDSPWTAHIIVTGDTPIGAVIDAHRRIRALCSVEVNFHVGEGGEPAPPRSGWPFMMTTSNDPHLDRFVYQPSNIPPYGRDETLLWLRQDETLDQFGARTGCAQVSPLRP